MDSFFAISKSQRMVQSTCWDIAEILLRCFINDWANFLLSSVNCCERAWKSELVQSCYWCNLQNFFCNDILKLRLTFNRTTRKLNTICSNLSWQTIFSKVQQRIFVEFLLSFMSLNKMLSRCRKSYTHYIALISKGGGGLSNVNVIT